MTLRGFSIFALLLALGVGAAWLWFGRGGIHPAIPAEPAISHRDATRGRSGTDDLPAPAAPAREVASPEPETKAITPAEPARVTSSVVPGMPLVRTAPTASRPVVAALPAAAHLPTSRPEPQSEGRADLEGVRFMLRDFRTRMGENPVGSNAEIMRAVMGGNEAKANLGPPAGQSLNEQGELVDRWGTPYFFHQLSKNSMEVRSAGPDRKMWTPDDLIGK